MPDLLGVFRSWLLNVHLHTDTDRRTEIEAAERLIEAGDLGEAVSTAELRTLLSR